MAKKRSIVTLKSEKKRLKKVAKELFYPKEVQEKIDNAQSIREIFVILSNARIEEEKRC